MSLTQSWLIDRPALTHAIARTRTHEARVELAHAVIAASGPPDWHQSHAGRRAYEAALVVAERVGANPDVLIEALLWDTDIAEWCWGEVHERCCEEGFEHAERAIEEAITALWDGDPRPAWISPVTWKRLRAKVRRIEARSGHFGEALAVIEDDNDLYDEHHDEGVRRHMTGCLRGSVGGDFHSTP